MKHYQLKKIVILLVTIGFLGAGFLPSISSSNISYKQNSILSIGFEVAQKVAETKIYLSKSSDYFISESIQIKRVDDSPIMYIFFLNPTGYIVIPANKYLPPIIAYSFENEFGDISEENILLQMLKADISSRIDHIDLISEDIIKNRDEQWQKYSSLEKINQQNIVSKVGPLLDTKWSQYAPYNNFCPIDLDSGDRSVAGCPAVAMAQILNYHRTTQNVQFSDEDDYYHNYAGNRYTIDDDFKKYDFPSFPELNNYLNTLQYNYENEIPLTDNDKAALNFACGIAAEQDYNPAGSGTFNVTQAYQSYQRFYFEDIELLTEGSDVYNWLQSNILEGLPAHIAVVNEGWDAGHNMVVDGYDDEGYFHINFGWNGSYNGWYMLPEELPLELTVLEGIIVDIYPTSQNGSLGGSGILNWVDVSPGLTVTGSFIIQNNGSLGSSIDWEIVSWPDWGTWTFLPDSGEDLTPDDGGKTINVSVIVPDEKNENFAGYVKIVDTKDSSDYCLIHISLTTPKSLIINHSTLRFLKQQPYLFLLLKNIISLK
ncbi:MAG: C10 family peptidase [Candidatus Thermoplasmatota archaeon]|nr:C10 family peptidase [Candidatus Thermoplasmatota archaeon]